MTIESYLERIAKALERLVELAESARPPIVVPTAQIVQPAASPAVTTATEVREPVPEAEKPKRGRPPKAKPVETPPADAPAPAAEETAVASFLDEPNGAPTEAPKPTIDDVRQALTDLMQRKGGGQVGRDAAYKVMFDAGNKAVRIPGSPKDLAAAGAPGALKEEYFQAVIDAAKKVK